MLCVLVVLTPKGNTWSLCSVCTYIGVCFHSGCEHVTLISVHLHTILLSEIKQDNEIRGLQRGIFQYQLHLTTGEYTIFLK